MRGYIIIRLLQAILTLWVLSVIVFVSVHLTGDPAAYLLGPDTTNETYEQLKINLGLDKPLPVQYWNFLKNASRGDFGISVFHGSSARDILISRLPATLELAGAALF